MKDRAITNQEPFEENRLLKQKVKALELSESALKKVEEALQERTYELNERVKELECLYRLSELVETGGDSIDLLIQGAAELLPPAMQYPFAACARITLNGRIFRTANFEQTSWRLQRSIVVYGKQFGNVEVGYLEAHPDSDEGPFVRQEGLLLRVVAERLGKAVERIRSRQVLQESEERHRTILQTAMDGIWRVDRQGHLLEVNEAYCRMSGYSKQELLAMRVSDLEATETRDEIDTHIQKIMAQGEDRFETRQRRKDGTIFDVEVSVQYRSAKEDEFVVFLHDITGSKQAEQERQRQRKELSQISRLATVGEFAASIAHEVNQPLAAILNNAQAAQRFLSSDTPVIDEVRDALEDIINDDRRASEVIRHLRSFLKREETDREILDINSIIAEVLRILQHEIIDRQISVTPDLSRDIPPVECNRIALQQVLMNLILNGCDSLVNREPQERQMHIRTSVGEPDSLVVAVQDSGTGLGTSEIDRVFEPYYTTKQEGLGMGLSISKSIITVHGGRIWAENNPDGGATFSFTLPIYKGKAL